MLYLLYHSLVNHLRNINTAIHNTILDITAIHNAILDITAIHNAILDINRAIHNAIFDINTAIHNAIFKIQHRITCVAGRLTAAGKKLHLT